MKLTPADILAKIVSEEYHVFSGRLTVCVLTLQNGFLVTGESSCVDPKEFSEITGEALARQAAIERIWLLEGYLLKEYMFKLAEPEQGLQ